MRERLGVVAATRLLNRRIWYLSGTYALHI